MSESSVVSGDVLLAAFAVNCASKGAGLDGEEKENSALGKHSDVELSSAEEVRSGCAEGLDSNNKAASRASNFDSDSDSHSGSGSDIWPDSGSESDSDSDSETGR